MKKRIHEYPLGTNVLIHKDYIFGSVEAQLKCKEEYDPCYVIRTEENVTAIYFQHQLNGLRNWSSTHYLPGFFKYGPFSGKLDRACLFKCGEEPEYNLFLQAGENRRLQFFDYYHAPTQTMHRRVTGCGYSNTEGRQATWL